MPNQCLIVIDMLNDFLERWDLESSHSLIANTNNLISEFRSANCPVLWVRQAYRTDLSDAFLEMRDHNISITIEGTRGAEIHSDLERHSADIVITKKRYSAFFGTELDSILNQFELEGITLAGVNTHACIRTTAIDAYQRDIRVTIAEDCVGSSDEKHGRLSLDYMNGGIATVLPNKIISDALM